MAALPAYLILGLGALSGGIVKGVTGFGNAIINLLVWVSFTAAGVDAGSLQQAVLADTMGCVVCSVPLLLMTAAHKTADWRLVMTLLIFTTVGAPLGAALLTHLPVRWVELVMAWVLLLVICLHIKLHEAFIKALRSWKTRSRVNRGLLDQSATTSTRRRRFSPGSAPTSGQVGMDPDASLHSVAVDCLPTPLPAGLAAGVAEARGYAAQAQGLFVSPDDSDAAAALIPDRCDTPDADMMSLLQDHSGASRTAEADPDLPTRDGSGCTCKCSKLQPQADFTRAADALYGAAAGAEEAVVIRHGQPAATSPEASAKTLTPDAVASYRVAACECRVGVDVLRGQEDLRTGDDAATCVQDGPANATVHSDTQPLLDRGVPASDAIAARPSPHRVCAGAKSCAQATSPGACGRSCCPSVEDETLVTNNRSSGIDAKERRVTCNWVRGWLARQDWPEMRRILAVGSVAGCASGVMGGMTGIGGPPIMFMYEKLKVPKEVVRGTNAVNNVLQVRLVSYIIMGVFRREDVPLFAVTSVVGLVGVFIGNTLAGRLDQKGFSRVLVALMVICCLLLFASAAGIKGKTAHA